MRDDQDAMLRGIKNSKLKVYQSTGHALHWEHPKRFAGDLMEFIGGLYAPKTGNKR